MTNVRLPSPDVMYEALVRRDTEYEGVFFVAVKTTGIFCRPTCSARKPKRTNVEFYRTACDALSAGFRPCRRCKPLEVFGAAPSWINELLRRVEEDPSKRWTDADLRRADIEPTRVRRWFKQYHGMTFHTYQRTRRLAMALGQINVGSTATRAAFENGFESLSGFRDAFKQWCGAPPQDAAGGPPIIVNRVLTPLGPMAVAATDDGICLAEFADRRMLETQFKRVHRQHDRPFAPGHHAHIDQLSRELEDYFSGNRIQFEVKMDVSGSDFQMQTWKQLQRIPYGETTSYEQMARAMGRTGAQRAVGRANGDNRLAILIPCHRVVRSDGSLSGYGGGIWRKQWLLDHERNVKEARWMLKGCS